MKFNCCFRVHITSPVNAGKTAADLRQTAVPVPRGMTLPCALLMLSSLVVAWFVMPYVALIKTSVLVYALTGLTNTKLLSGVRVLILLGLACLVYVHAGFFAATWTFYIPGCVYVGFLCNSPLSANRRRGLIGLLALNVSPALANGTLLMTGSLMGMGWNLLESPTQATGTGKTVGILQGQRGTCCKLLLSQRKAGLEQLARNAQLIVFS